VCWEEKGKEESVVSWKRRIPKRGKSRLILNYERGRGGGRKWEMDDMRVCEGEKKRRQ